MMELQNLLNLIASLPPKKQEAVEEFVRYIQQEPSSRPAVSFRDAVDTFMREHSELLKRLAE